MKGLKISFLLLVACIAFFSCKRNKLKIDVSDVKIDLQVKHLDNSLFEIDTTSFENSVEKIKAEYGEFFDIFTYKIINIGGINDPHFFSLLKMYTTDTMILNTRKEVRAVFGNFSRTEKQLTKAFKHYNYYFPEKEVPEIYTCISGFNQSLVTSAGLIGISLDKYLGKDFSYYKRLDIPNYKLQKMYKEKIAADVMYSWALTEFENKSTESTLLSHMVYEGKLMYFVDAMLPKQHDTLKIGYTEKQLEWCKNNEAQMWFKLVEDKRLYITGRMDIKRFISDGPYTNGFPLESPGRTGVWLGWQIVRKFMDKHPEVTLPQLMEMHDAQKLLNASGYFPE